ncbi:WD repeat-containing protein 70-like [Garra rufa]|uniref:WD repeat-containing protein 70-like n=1 Tax=Garra rufa TaxID=137080 RepID=UPI003CCEAB86
MNTVCPSLSDVSQNEAVFRLECDVIVRWFCRWKAYGPQTVAMKALCVSCESINGAQVHTKFHCRQAHAAGSDTSCLTFSYDGVTLASRGGDDTMKTWDMRNFRKPLAAVSGLTSFFPMTDCCFSPDDKLLLTGTSVKKDEGNGKLLFYERESLQKVYEIEVADASVVRCLWHPKLNQIMVGTGNGLAKVYYDPVKSQRGAMLCVVKSMRKEKHAETLTQDYIITPHALPMFREARQRSTRKQLEKDRLDPVRSHKPEPPVSGPGRGGRVAAHGGTLSSFIVKNIALDKLTTATRERPFCGTPKKPLRTRTGSPQPIKRRSRIRCLPRKRKKSLTKISQNGRNARSEEISSLRLTLGLWSSEE